MQVRRRTLAELGYHAHLMLRMVAQTSRLCDSIPTRPLGDRIVEINQGAATMSYRDAIIAALSQSRVGTTMRLATESSPLCAPAFPRSGLAACCARQPKQPPQRLCRRQVQRQAPDSLQTCRRMFALSNQAGGYIDQHCVLHYAMSMRCMTLCQPCALWRMRLPAGTTHSAAS